ncbi:MAG: translocation/assembly module TamB domain-containing protein [Sphingomonadaceae bacterium]|uniref:translocation/assembly module TamB domain-containing protein n=1 Tax=Thermaurantiacus sp. TaxID=2820283 RepID=UPI00298F2472|nr:translocation/assembly module TamB domain-containing protein [Thermaurantiacus sp.]MCS6987189.1 translocation/assembly module TamB domain-containing protein [Sphingomonadaceae bacterium]MDW8415777.1 translocation/assembly module TamB domain-containing protein [Thermaurantiacus sp.]
MRGEPPPGTRPPRPRWLAALLAILAGLVLVAVGLIAFLSETQTGRDLVARRLLPVLRLDSGLALDVARIEGSLLSRPRLLGVRLLDPAGPFATAPRVEVDWQAAALLRGRVRIVRLDVPQATLRRSPRLRPTPPDEPLLPDVDLAIAHLAVGRLVVAPAVAGVAETVGIAGRLALAQGRLLVDLDARGRRGDRLDIRVDVEPDRNRLHLGLRLEARADGLVAGLLGIRRPLTVRLEGRGDWRRWDGELAAATGSTPLAALAIAARAARWRVTGRLEPGPFLADGILARVAGPVVAVDGEARPGRTRDQTRWRLSVAGAGGLVEAVGTLDRAREALTDARADLTLASPDRLDPRLAGPPVRMALRAQGPVRAPRVVLTAESPKLSFRSGAGPLTLDGPRVRFDWERPAGAPRLDLELRARGIEGLPPPLAPLARQPQLRARLLRTSDTWAVEDWQFITQGLTGRGTGRIAPAQGRGELGGRLGASDLEVPGWGRVRADLAGRIEFASGGRPSAQGEMSLAVRTLTSPTALAVLGGPPRLTLAFAWDGARLTMASGRFESPAWNLSLNEGRLEPAGGRFALAAAGRSRDYGPAALDARGTFAAPQATLRLARPGFGLTDLVARIAPAPGGWALDAQAGTPEGPARAVGHLAGTPGRPTVFRLDSLRVGRLEASGQVIQTPAGPFAGGLTLSGPGLDGMIRLADDGGVQAVRLTASLVQAPIPFVPAWRVATADADVRVALATPQPVVEGEVAARGVSQGRLEFRDFTARGRFIGADGQATLRLAGQAEGRPLTLVADLSAQGRDYQVGLDGAWGELPFRLERPARIRRLAGGYELSPVRMALAGGMLEAAGRLDGRTALRLRLSQADVAILRLLGVGPRLAGRLSADVEARWDPSAPWPVGRARLDVQGLAARAGLAGLPEVRILADVTSRAEAVEAGVVVRGSRGTDGRVRLTLVPGAGATPVERRQAARLAGGIRYRGPAETLWSFLDLPDQSVAGALMLAADLSGTLAAPRLQGRLRADGLSYRNFTWGTRMTDVRVESLLEGERLRLVSASGEAGGGRVTGSGEVRLSGPEGAVIDLALAFERARLADSPSTRIAVSGPLRVAGSLTDLEVSGRLRIEDGTIRLGALQSVAATSDIVVREKGAPPPPTDRRPSRVGLDLRLSARDSVKVQGLGLDSFWGADLRVGGDLATPRVLGEARMTRGTFDFAGRSFEIRRGLVGFTGDPLDSSLAIEASGTSEGFTATVTIDGTVRRPEVRFGSQPPLPEDEVLARLLFGASVADLSAAEALQLAAAAAGLKGGTGGLDPLGRIQRASGLDRIRLVGDDARTGLGSGIAIGERLGRNLYLEVATDTQGNALTRVELALTRVLSLLAHVTTLGRAGVDLRYAREY